METLKFFFLLKLFKSFHIEISFFRNEDEYTASHIVTAKHHTSLHSEYGCLIDVPGQLELFSMIIV